MDFVTIFKDHFVLVVMIACLIVGYILKHATFMKWLPNDNIPIVLAVFGAILNPVVCGLTVDTVVYGAFMGLASTGFHQAFKTFVENFKVKTE